MIPLGPIMRRTLPETTETAMPKGQQRSNREKKKPKKPVVPVAPRQK
jgi:hypothetical protein